MARLGAGVANPRALVLDDAHLHTARCVCEGRCGDVWGVL